MQFKDALIEFKLGNLAKAIECCEKLIQSGQAVDKSNHLLANIAYQQGNYLAAEKYASISCQLNDKDANFWITLGATQNKQGKKDLSLISYQKSIENDPNNFAAHFNSGNVFRSMGEHKKAVASYQRALAVNKKSAEAWIQLGQSFQALNFPDQAINSYKAAIGIAPENSTAIICSAISHLEINQVKTAHELIKEALSIDPNSFDAWQTLGNILIIENRFEEAKVAYLSAVQKSNGTNLSSLNNLAICHQMLGNFNDPDAIYKKIIELDQNFFPGLKNYSHYLLLNKRHREGFELYESRLQQDKFINKTPIGINPWDGKTTLENKKILVLSEQGFGDTIQFSRYLIDLQKYCSKISFLCEEPLLRLFKDTFSKYPKIEIVSSTDQNHDFYCFLLSLPHLLYLKYENPLINISDQIFKTNQGEQLKNKDGPLNIGIAVMGRKDHPLNRFRSISPHLFSKVLSTHHHFFLIQKETYDDLSLLSHMKNVRNMSANIHDFKDTANILNQLDMVISVDTSLAHLSCSMGIETIILLPALPDWRWGLKSSTTEWYKSATLIRQKKMGDWEPVIDEITLKLQKLGN